MPLISGKKILDLSRIIAGPYATMILSDFGCSVLKVEPPEGDASRMWGPPWVEKQSAYFMSINRNKKSITLNLKEQKCREILYRLAADSDAVIQNFVPGVTEKLGIDYQTLKKYNNKLVYCSISGFGDIGEKKNFPAFDNLIQAQTGFMHLTGDKNGDPYKLGFAIADVVTSLFAANALLAGMIHQMQTGEGIHVKTSLYQCAVASLINQSSNYLNGGVNPQRLGNHHPNIVPYGLYNTKTLPVIICVGTPHQYQGLKVAFGVKGEQFQTNDLRVQNRQAFNTQLNKILSQYTLEQVIHKLQGNKIPCGRVNDLHSLFSGKTVQDLQLVKEVEGKKFVRSPIRSNSQLQPITVPPKLNQHGRQILASLGLSKQQIQQIQRLNKHNP